MISLCGCTDTHTADVAAHAVIGVVWVLGLCPCVCHRGVAVVGWGLGGLCMQNHGWGGWQGIHVDACMHVLCCSVSLITIDLLQP
jgi:hypothetical protein